MMIIQLYQGNSIKVDERADFNIVIDVIRAFTVSHVAFLRGVTKIYLMHSTEEAFLFRKNNPSVLLAGEIKGLLIPGFDFDNSPVKFSNVNLMDKELVQKTTNGVRATLNALNADNVLVTGLTNADNVIEFVKGCVRRESICNPVINIIASDPMGDEDLACAEYIKGQLMGTNIPVKQEVKERIKGAKNAQKFIDPNNNNFLLEDINICISEIQSEFVMIVKTVNNIPVIVRESV